MSQTSTFVKKLAANDRPTREAALEALRKFLVSRSSSKLPLLEMEKLWKGLYYSMWFCDRPRPQERLAENLGKLYSETIPVKLHGKFLEAFWTVMIKEWPSIDQWRIDKFYLLIRRVLRHNFKQLKSQSWDKKYVDEFLDVLVRLPLSGDKSISVALPYHLCDIYMDELELVIFEELSDLQEELDEQDERDLELYKTLFKKKLDIVNATPIVDLISPFEKLNKNAPLKTLREKCKEDVLDDKRLKEWGVVGGNDSDSDEDDEEKDEDSEDEWKGF